MKLVTIVRGICLMDTRSVKIVVSHKELVRGTTL